MFSNLFKKEKSGTSDQFEKESNSKSWSELPGYSAPSIEDLNFEVFNFERSVKRFLEHKSQPTNKKLVDLIDDMKGFPPNPSLQAGWDIRIKQMQELRNLRNKFIHHELDKLHKVIDDIQYLGFDKSNRFMEMYNHFRDFNRMLIPLKLCSGDMSRFELGDCSNGIFSISVDDQEFQLTLDDISNLQCELGVDYRGKVNFTKGKLVVGKVQSFSYDSVTYFIEGYKPFTLTFDEMSVLSDFLDSVVGYHSEVVQ